MHRTSFAAKLGCLGFFSLADDKPLRTCFRLQKSAMSNVLARKHLSVDLPEGRRRQGPPGIRRFGRLRRAARNQISNHFKLFISHPDPLRRLETKLQSQHGKKLRNSRKHLLLFTGHCIRCEIA